MADIFDFGDSFTPTGLEALRLLKYQKEAREQAVKQQAIEGAIAPDYTPMKSPTGFNISGAPIPGTEKFSPEAYAVELDKLDPDAAQLYRSNQATLNKTIEEVRKAKLENTLTEQQLPASMRMIETKALQTGMQYGEATNWMDKPGILSFLNPYEDEGEKTVDVQLRDGVPWLIDQRGKAHPVNEEVMMKLNASYDEQYKQFNLNLRHKEDIEQRDRAIPSDRTYSEKKDYDTHRDLWAGAQRSMLERAHLDRFRAAVTSGKFPTGTWGPARHAVSTFADFLGLNPEELGLGLGDPVTADTMKSATAALAVEAAAEQDRPLRLALEFVIDSLPSLSHTEEGGLILADAMDAIADYRVELFDLSERYQSAYGTYYPKGKKSFYRAALEYAENNPIITEELKQRIREGTKGRTRTWDDFLPDSMKREPQAIIPQGYEFVRMEDGKPIIKGPDGKLYKGK